jgi:hypothetical protein
VKHSGRSLIRKKETSPKINDSKDKKVLETKKRVKISERGYRN